MALSVEYAYTSPFRNIPPLHTLTRPPVREKERREEGIEVKGNGEGKGGRVEKVCKGNVWMKM